MVNNKLIIVSGINGSLGEAYLNYYQNKDNMQIVGIARTKPEILYSRVQYKQADLLDRTESIRCIKQLSLEEITKILFIHPVGAFKFEQEFDEIDPKIYASNVDTFTNLSNAILERIAPTNIDLTLVGFGSISDKYNVSYWQSYSKSKNALREYIKEQAYKKDNVRGIFFNLSSVKTSNEVRLRPFANTSYWLTPEEIVGRSVLELSFTGKWKEVDIFNLAPDFSPEIYKNNSRVLERWTREMYGK